MVVKVKENFQRTRHVKKLIKVKKTYFETRKKFKLS